MNITEKQYITKQELCQICNISESTAYKLLKSKKLNFEKCCDGLLHYYKIPLCEVLEYMREQAEKGHYSEKQKEMISRYYRKRSVIFMMTAKINFITNNLLVDMTCRETELRDSLQNIGILIVPSMIYLDNRCTLQIQLNANDEVGEIVKTLINTERDTLGTVQRLCRSVYCLNAKHRAELLEMIENGEITTAAEGIEMAKRLREPMQMCR